MLRIYAFNVIGLTLLLVGRIELFIVLLKQPILQSTRSCII